MLLIMLLDTHSVLTRNMQAVHLPVMVVVIVPVRVQVVVGRVDYPVIVMTATCHHVTGTGDKII